MIQLQNGWGQFTPKNWGQFAPEYWGQFHAEKGGLFGRNFHDACDIGYGGLRCYEDSALGLYHYSISNCEYSDVGIQEEAENKMVVYPNPGSDIITITGLSEKAEATIMDATGRIVLVAEVNNNKVDVSLLANGVYVVRVETVKGVSNFRIIKQ